MAKTAKKRTSRIRVGTQFRHHYADGQPMWKVTKILRRGVYQCEVGEDELDWAGVTRIFAREEIQRAMSVQAFWAESEDANDAFYRSLEVGRIVHYHDGFGQFYRCEVVLSTREDDMRGLSIGQPCLRTIAVVGNWNGSDRYRIRPVGELMRPHAENIYENPRATSTHRWPDPSTALKPLKLG